MKGVRDMQGPTCVRELVRFGVARIKGSAVGTRGNFRCVAAGLFISLNFWPRELNAER
jgi:hypothetical protein